MWDNMKGKGGMKKLAVFLVTVLSLAPLHLLAQTNLPPVVVTAPSISGGNVLCRGDACAGVVASLQSQINGMNFDQGFPMEEDPPISKSQFCANLKATKPSGCNFSSPPSTPAFNPSWTPNGCGTDSMSTAIADYIVSQGYPVTGGTGLDNPAAGINFKSACDAHDRCYGLISGKATCDGDFAAGLADICQASSNTACSTIAGVYSSAATNLGNDAYALSVTQNVCAAWASDMQVNGCSP